MSDIKDIMTHHHIHRCISCGRCTGSCPMSALDSGFSPRRIVERSIMGSLESLVKSDALWKCWTCGHCSEACHLEVNFPLFMRDLRTRALSSGMIPEFPHHGIIQSSQSIMARSHSRTLRPPPGNIERGDRKKVLLFRGCTAIYDIIFGEYGIALGNTEEAVTALLDAMGYNVFFLEDERCCGHDLLWSGYHDLFTQLVHHNIEAIEHNGISSIVTFCPECCHTLKVEYPRIDPGFSATVHHWVELVNGPLPLGTEVPENPERRKAVYLDSCRMGRFLSLIDEPRRLLAGLPWLELTELEQKGRKAPCCGVSSWTSCSAASGKNQRMILEEVAALGADLLITSCPKCRIHLTCAARNTSGKGEFTIVDLADIMSGSLRHSSYITGGEDPWTKMCE